MIKPTPSVSPSDMLNHTQAGGGLKILFVLVAAVLFVWAIARTLSNR